MNSREKVIKALREAGFPNYNAVVEQMSELLDTHAAEARADQAEIGWYRSQHFLSQAGAWDCMQGVKDACINATGEE